MPEASTNIRERLKTVCIFCLSVERPVSRYGEVKHEGETYELRTCETCKAKKAVNGRGRYRHFQVPLTNLHKLLDGAL